MSAFCVFASSMLVARERAEKRVSTIDPATKKPMSEVDWRAKVEEKAVEIFVSMSPVQVSAAFDAPQFCDEWISVARPTGLYEGYVVKCRSAAAASTTKATVQSFSRSRISAPRPIAQK